MIPRSKSIAGSAIILATASHVLALSDFSTPEGARIEGSGSEEAAALGASFQDYVAGTSTPAPVTTRQESTVQAQKTPKVSAPVQTQASLMPTPTLSVPVQQTALQPSVVQDAPQPQETETAKVEPKAADTPQVNDIKKPEPEKEKVNQVQSQSGNSDKSAKKGSDAGQAAKGSATAKKAQKAATGQGNAEASNYGGQVKRRIARAKRKSVNVRGSAFVSFRIGDNGALIAVSISRSSGSKRLDQVALAQVRSAAPFPPPPAAARRDYTIEIKGK